MQHSTPRTTGRRSGFTLIELLIVVAIIAILAAIAVPNFLEAQVRSKVSRAKADMRTIATAIESYFVDNNRYPFTPPDVSIDVDGYGELRSYDMLTLPDSITTPVAYISSQIPDVFKVGKKVHGANASKGKPFQTQNPRDMTFLWVNMAQASDTSFGFFSSAQSVANAYEQWGQWQMRSVGPTAYYPGVTPEYPITPAPGGTAFTNISAIYDPTNGTVSLGQVIRNQKSSEGTQKN